jgi:putative flippase GtrA
MFIRYCMVGLVNTIICLLLMACGSYLGLPYLFYTPLAYGLAMLNSYLLNAWLIFEESYWDKQQLIRFFLMNLLNLLVVELCEYGLVEKVGMSERAAVLISMICYTILGFILNRQLVFNFQGSFAQKTRSG